MAEIIYPYALTTVTRIKTRLTITANSFDTLFLRLINSITDHIETQCDRHFIETTYTNEVYSVDSGDKVVMLRNYPVSSISSLEYRAGLNSSPSWTNYSVDDYYLLDRGQTGIVEYSGTLVSGSNILRATYVAGYKIDWPNYGSNTHTLPSDLTDLCERIVVRIFKRREAEGKSSETFESSSVNYMKEFNEEDKAVIERYKRMTLF